MSLPQSVCSLVRRSLKIKGATEHSGRGWYDMDYDCSPSLLIDRSNSAVNRWKKQNIIESSFQHSDGTISVVFVDSVTADGYYPQ